MLYYQDPDYRLRAQAVVFALEDYFCSRSWLYRALNIHTLTIDGWLDQKRAPNPAYLRRIENLLLFARRVDLLSQDQAQTGWWLICRHFDVDVPHSGLLYSPEYPAAYLHRERSAEIIERLYLSAQDDFLNESQQHRKCTPKNLAVPKNNQRQRQLTTCPWYLLNLPSHPTLADKRQAKLVRIDPKSALTPAIALAALLKQKA